MSQVAAQQETLQQQAERVRGLEVGGISCSLRHDPPSHMSTWQSSQQGESFRSFHMAVPAARSMTVNVATVSSLKVDVHVLLPPLTGCSPQC